LDIYQTCSSLLQNLPKDDERVNYHLKGFQNVIGKEIDVCYQHNFQLDGEGNWKGIESRFGWYALEKGKQHSMCPCSVIQDCMRTCNIPYGGNDEFPIWHIFFHHNLPLPSQNLLKNTYWLPKKMDILLGIGSYIYWIEF
jgi:hypothetical protein